MSLIHKLPRQSVAILRQAAPAGLFPPDVLSSIVAVSDLSIHRKRLGRNSSFRDFKSVLQEMRHQGPTTVLSVWRARRHCRRELRRLLDVGPHMIADVGLTLDQARDEVTQPFWRETCLGEVRDGDKPHRLTAHAVDRFHSNRPARSCTDSGAVGPCIGFPVRLDRRNRYRECH